MIECDPGEFPTGDKITFASDSDIRITNGQAAIEFRSYHGGETLIRASSPGLADATIIIRTEGEPAFIEGLTPRAAPRPYITPIPSQASLDAMRNAVNVALNRPCRASSESDGHPARFANDGNSNTAWIADEPSPAWQLDLEGYYQLASLKLLFSCGANYRFLVELSSDAINWSGAIDRRDASEVCRERNEIFPPGAIARYVQIRFSDLPNGCRANLAEVEIQGVLSPK
jgi:hypothetical protein